MPKSMIKKCDRVRFRVGSRPVTAWVVEDRGAIGVGGRQLVVVETVPSGVEEEATRFTMPAEELTRLPKSSRGRNGDRRPSASPPR